MSDFGGSFSVEIDVPIERCYAVAADVESAPEWHGSMKAADALEHDADGQPTLVDAIVASVRLKLRFSYEPLERMTSSAPSRAGDGLMADSARLNILDEL